MPDVFSESTAVTVKLGWLIAIVTLLMGLASTGGVLAYQVSELRAEVKALTAERVKDRESIIALTATLQANGTIK